MRKKITCIFTILVVSWSTLSLPILGAQNETSNPIYNQVIEKLESLSPGETIEVKLGIQKEEYNVGEPVEVRFQTSKDCYIVLMDISAAEKDSIKGEIKYADITFLIPNYKFTDGKIEGGRVYSTLYDFGLKIKVGPPYGFDTLNLFCSPEKIELFEPDFGKEPVYTIRSDDEDRLKVLLNRLDQLQQQEWSGTSVSFYIKGARGVPRKFGALPPIGATGTTGKWFPPISSTGTTGKR
jgi:hypothetical protein